MLYVDMQGSSFFEKKIEKRLILKLRLKGRKYFLSDWSHINLTHVYIRQFIFHILLILLTTTYSIYEVYQSNQT